MKFKKKFTIKQGVALTKMLREKYLDYCTVEVIVKGHQNKKPIVVYAVYIADIDMPTKEFKHWLDAVAYVLVLVDEPFLRFCKEV